MTAPDQRFFETTAKFIELDPEDVASLAIWSGRPLPEDACRKLVLPCLFDLGLGSDPRIGLGWAMPRIENDTILMEVVSLDEDNPESTVEGVTARHLIDSFAAEAFQEPVFMLVAERDLMCVYEFPRFSLEGLEQFAMCGGFMSTWFLVADQIGTCQMIYNDDFQLLAISQAPSRGELRLGDKPVEFWNERFETILPQEAVGQVHIDRMNELYVPRVKGMKPLGPFRR